MEKQCILVGNTVQPRRNDWHTDVENRAHLLMRGIHEESVDLVSVGDRGKLRRVSAEYAREYLKLAHSSTVRETKGDTSWVRGRAGR